MKTADVPVDEVAGSVRGTPSARSQSQPPLLVDAHVHCHPSFTWNAFLSAAWNNFGVAARRLNLPKAVGCLLLTESRGMRRFGELLTQESIGHWSIARTSEPCSVTCRDVEGEAIIIIAGRQIVTREGLEVLALACDHRFTDGQPLVGLIQQVNALGGVAVVPWGFGKWWLRRGTIVRRLLRSQRNLRVALGDNGGRARFSPRPRLFARAEAFGIPVLPGSDPLPFTSEINRVGSFGFVLRCDLDEQRPAASITNELRALRSSPRSFGRRTPLMRFAGLQLAMQFRMSRRMVGGRS